MLHRINIKTGLRVEFQEITPKVRDLIKASGIQDGSCHIVVPHTTAGVTINEHADPSVVQDIVAHLETLVPQHRNYRHAEGNSPAHIKASLVGNSATLLIEGGKLILGTWQGVFFCEFDGPRNRTLLIKLVPDKS